ncbi:unnamed protein product [Scytosiphon promiscuus]
MANYIYHLVEEAKWREAGSEGYFPPTFEADGFIHATRAPEHLLPVANHIYTDVPGNFLCLRIDISLLKAEVKFEAAAPVGDKPALIHSDTEGGDGEAGKGEPSEQPLAPHIYGAIEAAGVVAELAVERSDDGGFLSIEGV